MTLNNGVQIPQLGFGVFQVPPEQTERVVSLALETGYRSIDTAAAYGNEEGVGRAIASSGLEGAGEARLRRPGAGDRGGQLHRRLPAAAVDRDRHGAGRHQVELHPYFPQTELRAVHAEHGIATEAWSPLAQGGELLSDATITRLADHHGVTPAQVVLRWHLQIGNIVIPKSVTPARIRENLAVFDFDLSPADLAAIAALNTGRRRGADPTTFALT